MNFKRLRNNSYTPTRGTKESAGWDLYADTSYEIEILPGKTVMIGTGIAMEIPDGCFGALFARSGLASKHGVRPANCVGVIDADYRGEIMIALHNDSDKPYYVTNGERIAQLVVIPYLTEGITEVDDLGDTDRGSGGFGSTGGFNG